ncbi:LmeA family phospholipid-binding protein [Streptomyces sp. MUM 178J]|uniref:LmeA family phospholipid-binding protein n=1 Tax=Streptomyces sp. MUM 178J TaxID=2791991 RepID=UPI001F0472D2|nr:DUF2993 domain-containing protein [Streptomyces sp. MUM 178J]WRQ78663.1 DUF2993 domain-containing protein [Streptomyces sp. MUM 178J]
MTPRRAGAAAAPRRPRTGGRPPAAGRRRRVGAAAAVLALVLAVGLPVADGVSRRVAEGRLADRVAAERPSVRGEPDVDIAGGPFLLEAARDRYPEVRVQADAVTERGRPVRADLTFRDVSGRPDGYRARSADARFTVSYDSLGATGIGAQRRGRAPAPRLSYAGDGQVLVHSTVLGMTAEVTADVVLAEGAVALHPVSVSVAGRAVDPSGPLVARAFTGARLPLPALPLGLTPSGVSAGPEGVTLSADAGPVALS